MVKRWAVDTRELRGTTWMQKDYKTNAVRQTKLDIIVYSQKMEYVSEKSGQNMGMPW